MSADQTTTATGPDTLSLAGKVAIVTGSSRENGIGAAIALALGRNGASVAVTYATPSSEKRAEAVAESIRTLGGKAIVVVGDLKTEEGAEKIVQETIKAFGEHIDILVNNAGFGSYHSSLKISKEELDHFFQLNVYSAVYMTQRVVPHMSKGGRIINISSISAKIGMGGMPIYGATKAALDSLTYAWAQEFGKSHGITVNSIAPGPVPTDATNELVELQALAPFILQLTRAEDRFGTTQDIADATLLLVSEKGRWITGQHISVSGGITGQ